MSAYGTVSRPSPGKYPLPLPSRVYPLKRPIEQFNALVFVHFHQPSAAFSGSSPAGEASKKAVEARTLPAQWREKLYTTFQGVLKEGKTYPQYGPLTLAEFDSYYLDHDLVVGILTADAEVTLHDKEGKDYDVAQKLGNLEEIDSERIGAFYYIKPNYPGRSSHLCNGGFIVPPGLQGGGVGTCAGRSFLYFAPRLGYRGSVFNLVYATNEASARIWDNLGFDRVGRIPEAGKLATEDGSEKYVDAWVVHGDFKKLAPGVVLD